MENSVLFKLGYGLYVLTAQHEGKDNGCIINTAMHVAGGLSLGGVIAINKLSHTRDMIVKSKKFNISILTTETPFDIFQRFGFQSGTTVDKFSGCEGVVRSKNGVVYLTKYANAYLSFDVSDTTDFGSYTMFKAEITDSGIISDAESLTYAYYRQYIKPKLQAGVKTGYRCAACGYVEESGSLPADFVCPFCKHYSIYFEKI